MRNLECTLGRRKNEKKEKKKKIKARNQNGGIKDSVSVGINNFSCYTLEKKVAFFVANLECSKSASLIFREFEIKFQEVKIAANNSRIK